MIHHLFHPNFCPKSGWLIWCIYWKIICIFFDITLLYYFLNFRSPIICCLFSGDIHFSFGIFLSRPIFAFSFAVGSRLFFHEVIRTFIILSAILLPIKSPVASAVFFNYSFVSIFSVSVPDRLAWSKRFWLYIVLTFLLIFLPIFLLIFLMKNKNPLALTNIRFSVLTG